MTDHKVTVSDREQQVVDAARQVHVVRAQESGLLTAVENAIQTIEAQATAMRVDVTEVRQQITSLLQQVSVQEGGGIGLTVNQTGGANTFLALSDTPAAYTGAGGYFARVKTTEDGLEFIDLGISALEGRVSDAESSLTIALTSIGSLETTVGGHTVTLSGQSSAILQLQTDVDTAEGLISSHASLIAGVQADVTSLDNSINAHAGSLAALDSRVTVNEGAISANSSLILQVQTDLSTAEGTISANSSAISSLQSSVSDLDGDVVALAAVVDAVQATHTSMNNNITANANGITALGVLITANEDAISAVASDVSVLSTSLDATNVNVSTNASDILTAQSDINTLEGTVSAHASSITTLQATVVNNTTGISNNASATAALAVDVGDLEGDVYASYTVTLDVNGKITGIKLIGGGGASAFNVRADYFTLYTSAGLVSVYGDGSGYIYVSTSRRLVFIGHASTPGVLEFAYSTYSVMMYQASANFVLKDMNSSSQLGISDFTSASISIKGNIQITANTATGYIYLKGVGGELYIGQTTSEPWVYFKAIAAGSNRTLYFEYVTTWQLRPSTANSVSLGTATYTFKDLHLAGDANIAGNCSAGVLYCTTSIHATGNQMILYTDTVDGYGNANYIAYGNVNSGGYAIFRIATDSGSGMGQIRCHYGSYSSNYFVYMYHDGSYGYVGSYYGSLRFYAGNTYAAFLESDGDLYLSGVLYESSWSLDAVIVEEKKWELLASVVEAYRSHDGSKLSPEIRKELKFDSSRISIDGSPSEKETTTTYGRRTSDLIQVATACITDLLKRVEKLEKAA